MLEFFRRHRGTFMIVLTVVIIISFSTWGGWRQDNGPRMATSSDDAFTLYGDTYTVAEMQRLQRTGQVISMLQMFDLYFGLMSASRSGGMGNGEDFLINLLVLRRQMEDLGIAPSDAEARAVLEKLPSMQENGQFSQQRAFGMQQNLGMYGMGGQDMLEVAKLSIGLEKIRGLVGNNYVASAVESEKDYASQHQTLKVQTLSLNSDDFKKDIKVSDADLEKYFKENQDNYKSAEKRGVTWVLVPNPADLDKKPEPEQKKLNKEQVARVEKLLEAAGAPGAKFAAAATALKEKPEQAAAFARDAAPEPFKTESALLEALFAHHGGEGSLGDPVKTSKGWYVFHLDKIEAAKPQTLAEVKDKVRETLQTQKAQEALAKAINEARQAIADGLKAGKKAADIAKEKKLNLSAEREITVNEPPADLPNAREIANEAKKVAAGRVSKVINTDKGAMIAVVNARELRKRDNSASLRQNTADVRARQERERLFQAWFNARRAEAGLKMHLKPKDEANS
jgi:peptidyl-prolyl cis-trans isomerase D